MKKIILLIVLTSTQAHGNAFDKAIAKKLKWENTHVAAVLSDTAVASMIAAPYIMAYQDKEHRRGRISTAAVMHVLNFAMVDMIKMRAKRLRPNGYNNRSFYSGHTSTAFASAGLLCLQDKNSVCIAGLALASTVGYLRIAANFHWASDVLVGMGIGFLNGRYVPNLVVRF